MVFTPPLAQTPDPTTEEVRLAIALNGGVSLAVWMGGCAVELDCARRAHAGVEPVGSPRIPPRIAPKLERFWTGEIPRPKPSDVAPPDRVIYNALCTAFKRELVIDVMSGASAGGINGALLAAAIRNRRRLQPDFVRQKWLDLGDFSSLLHKTSNPEPLSLMQGQHFYDALEKAFCAVVADKDADRDDLRLTELPEVQRERVRALDAKLDVTMTNVRGTPKSFLDSSGRVLSALEYRARMRFREDADFNPQKLATAARSSASFPLAFEPWEVAKDPGALAGFAENRWVIDGGLLDNAPIQAVLELIPARAASRQVLRFVYYVNADPPEIVEDKEVHVPTLQNVVDYVVNIPRQARFVDQVYAIEGAMRRALIIDAAELRLITLELDSLTQTATALLPAYCRRQRFFSLELLLDDPAGARTAFEKLGTEYELPWVPNTLDPPGPGEWSWGIGTAERILHLLIDLLRDVLRQTVFATEREPILAAQAAIDSELAGLERIRRELRADPAVRGTLAGIVTGPDPESEVAALSDLVSQYAEWIRDTVERAAEAVYEVSTRLPDIEQVAAAEGLFGSSWVNATEFDATMFEAFLRRVLSIDVVRRTFSPDGRSDSAQPLQFAQLTPFAPGLIFSPAPLAEEGPATPEAKLTGIRLGHFAAFYRYSWRANDFMWGRLDAAAQIVDLLVDPVRVQRLELEDARPWRTLTTALLKDANDDQLWLIHEALVEGFGGYLVAAGVIPTSADLEHDLNAALKADLTEGDGELTRVICTRAAQLEIVAHELPLVDAESTTDAKRGSATEPLRLPLENGMRAAIEAVRDQADGTLPIRLGRDSGDEAASTLAVRTVTHAALVALAALRAAKLPLAHVLNSVRGFLLPVAGVVSRVPLYRLAVVASVWAAAMYLAVRLVTASPTATPELGMVIAKPILVAALMALVIAGVGTVPALRALRSESTARRVVQALWALVLLGTGFGVGLTLGLTAGNLSPGEIIGSPWKEPAPSQLLWAVIVLSAGIPAIRGPLRKPVNRFLQKPWGGPVMLVPVAVVVVWLGVWSYQELDSARDAAETWVKATAWTATLGAPMTAITYLFLRKWLYGLLHRS